MPASCTTFLPELIHIHAVFFSCWDYLTD